MSSSPDASAEQDRDHGNTSGRESQNTLQSLQQSRSEIRKKTPSSASSTPTTPLRTRRKAGSPTISPNEVFIPGQREDLLIDISPPFDPAALRPRNQPPVLVLRPAPGQVAEAVPAVSPSAHTRPESQVQGRQTPGNQQRDSSERQFHDGGFLDFTSGSQLTLPERARRLYQIPDYVPSDFGSEAVDPASDLVLSSSAATASDTQPESQASNKSAPKPEAPQEEDQAGCSICFEDFTSLSVVLPCGHGFDFECVYLWLEKTYMEIPDMTRLTCPLCRKIIKQIRHSEQPDGTFQTLDLEERFRGRRRRPDASWIPPLFSHHHGYQFHPHHYHGHGYVSYPTQHVGRPDWHDERLRRRPSPSHVLVESSPWISMGDYMSDEVFEAMDAAALARFIERNEERDNGGEGSSRYDRHERYRELDPALRDVTRHRERRRLDPDYGIRRRHLSPNSRPFQDDEDLTSSSRQIGRRQNLERGERRGSYQLSAIEILQQMHADRRREREEQGFGNGSNLDSPD